jgi:hypothetical protein
MNNTISVGFWRKTIDQLSDLPFPNQNTANYIEGFLEKFLLLKDKINNYRKNDDINIENFNILQYRGCSCCRICNCINGSSTVVLNGYSFPSGYFHYVDEHKIEVPLDFQHMICNLEL